MFGSRICTDAFPGGRKLLATLWRHRGLVLELTRREFAGRYQGSVGGAVWPFIIPVAYLALYSVAFGVVMNARWTLGGTTTEYVFNLFAGLIIYNLFSDVLIRSSVLIVSNQNYVKKIVFPLELLPLPIVLVALANAFIGLAVWIGVYMVLIGPPTKYMLASPLVLVMIAPMLCAAGWILSAVAVAVRDISQMIGLFSQSLLFMSPIFYTTEMAPSVLQKYLYFNPLTIPVEALRSSLLHASMPGLDLLFFYVVESLILFALARLVFRKIRPHFADLL